MNCAHWWTSSIGSRRPPPRSPASAAAQAAATRTRRSNGGPRRRRGRPRGSGNRAKQALELVRARPGITISELADAMGIKANTCIA